ncbi:MAG: carboxypeptidase-like regulatory domain-containing protein [Proteiniphilum sp.]|jgi:hypothetical protein|nr:carboxypeptidase-like regulatory domain-containing protein [Proteiniphilum sp.]NCB24299.1 carboxypeptidase regulatory-like domain-containing protein [Bacteroidia bacterium]MDD2936868.1 carboxypeptidase-like regulatory domain-containing protein [Proteiniphilum sp.]MDD3076779.1 carboxypeptidase-like regulatory domain-containing protein [Proteiniphilum sp.]MDD3779225.1 carboxypeptidase-like regulatory domain-containing protein [Proteiniphilum sp.]
MVNLSKSATPKGVPRIRKGGTLWGKFTGFINSFNRMKYYIALYQKLKEIYFSESSNENDLVLICPSLRLYEMEDLALLKPQSLITDPSSIAGSILKKQQVSYELNSLPSSDKYWDLNPNNTLFDAYREILNHAGVKELEQELEALLAAEDEILIRKGKETPEYKAYIKHLKEYEKQLVSIEDHLTQVDEQATEEDRKNWADQLVLLNLKKDMALANWKIKGYKDAIEKALQVKNKMSEKSRFLDLLQSVKNYFDASEKTDVTVLSAIHDIHFIPYDFMENESGWNNLFLDKNELESLFVKAKGDSDRLPTQILDIEYDEQYIESVEFDYAFIHLKRGWFNKQIFSSSLFRWEESQPISDGKTISADYKLSAFPKVMLLVKNLKINLIDAISEELVNSQNQIIHFGPMILKQQLFVNDRTKQKFLKTVTNKATIKSDQLNYMLRKADETALHTSLNKPVREESATSKPEIRTSRMTLSRRAMPLSLDLPGKVSSSRDSSEPKREALSLKMLPFKRADLFTKFDVKIVEQASQVFFNIHDSNTQKGIYKCSLSIKGTDNNRVFEVETDQNGQISVAIPIGSYALEVRADGYKVLSKSFKLENTNPVTHTFPMDREEVKFKSFFLVGMVCECIPKIPQ